MRLSRLKLFSLAILMIFSGLNVSCKESKQMPEKLIYKFSYGPLLQKTGDSVNITFTPHSSSAQRPQSGNLSMKQQSVIIDVKEFNSVWKKINKIDATQYTDIPDENFSPTPPDVNYTEKLRLVINDEVIIDWSREYGKLNDKLAGPLNEVNDALMELLNANLDEE